MGGPPAWLTEEPGPNPNLRSSNLNVRLRPADRDRLDRAAELFGLSTSAYARERLLGGSLNVRAWQRAYRLLLVTVDVSERLGVSGEVSEILADYRSQFETLAATVSINSLGGD